MKYKIALDYKNFMVVIILGLLMSTCSGCSTLGPLSSVLMGKKPSIEANVNIGKTVDQEKNNIKVEQGKTEQTADQISNDTSYQAKTITQITQDVPPYIIGLLILGFGWLIPEYEKCYSGVKWVLYDIVHGLIVNPIKGITNFILELKRGPKI